MFTQPQTADTSDFPKVDISPQTDKPGAAARLGITTRTINRHVKDGRLSAYRVGGLRSARFRIEDVAALLVPVDVQQSA